MNETLPPNTVISHYRVLSRLGAGGMGEVYLAQDTKLDRKVALKVLPADIASNSDRMVRFVREARSAAALNHPHIAQVYEIGEHDGVHFIVMEFIDGVTLRVTIHQERPELRKLLRSLQQVAEGLSKAHAAGIVHRDLKPDNIMITRDGFAKVLDFGLAKLIENRGPELEQADANQETVELLQHSVSGVVMGTVGYMSPEQALGKTREIDQRSDIFSFGCILFEAITGKRAFQGDSVIDSMHKLIYQPAPEIKELNPSAPADLQRIVSRCLEKDADERYQTIKDVGIELKNARRRMTDAIEMRPGSSLSETEQAGTSNSLDTSSDVSSGAELLAVPSTQSSVEYIVTGIRRHKLAAVLSIVVFAAALGGFAVYRSAAVSEARIESIAVLPFVNQSGNADAEYLSDGMTETLIRSLSQLPNLNVKARSSVFRYKGKEIDLKNIARELKAQAILLGRVEQRGANLTLSLELVDAQTENILWSEQYNRKQTDLVTLQSEIAHDVSTKINRKLSGADEQKLAKNDTANPEAYKLYLQGRFHWNKRSAEDFKKAIAQFKAAVDLDPNYALAYVGLADCYALLQEYAGTASGDTVPQAKAYATRALEIDDSLAEAHTSLGLINELLWNWTESEKQYKRGIESNPNYATARHWYSRFLRIKGRNDEALAEIRKAQMLDPLSPVIVENIAETLLEQGDVESALEQSEKELELDPDYWSAHTVLGTVYLRQGRTREALAAAQKGVELSGRSNTSLSLWGYVQALSGGRDEALAVRKELEDRYAKQQADGLDIAIVCAGLGENDQAFAWLEKAFERRSSLLAGIRLQPLLNSLQGDPRYADLLGRMGLPR